MDGVCGEFRVTYKIVFGDMNGINGRYNGRWACSYIRKEFKETLWYDLDSCVSRVCPEPGSGRYESENRAPSESRTFL
jgi:hypothetical protein